MSHRSLEARLVARIERDGPITVADYMEACLHDPCDGYYAVRPGLVADFVTAPHVSQMFGELLGAWAVEAWNRLGRPSRVRLVELGPGEGILIADVLRAARIAPGFLDAAEVVLLEVSAPLRERQAAALKGATPRWVSSIDEIGVDAPVLILANEFLDCAPIRQAVRGAEGWRERRVGLDFHGRLTFTPAEPRPEFTQEAPADGVIEWSPALQRLGADIGALVAKAGGTALMIDYGGDGPGDTLQALSSHRKESPLANPGFADLTAHVDFAAFLAAARAAGALTHPLKSHAVFLKSLGLETRAERLARANPAEAAKIGRQVARLTAPDEMGELFKVACVTSPDLVPPGFDVT